jgi:TPP-dependent pyruvate/acetoin dehydrogenase alpha subunit
MKGHAQHDNQAYVSKEALAEWQERDPIARYERVLEENGLMNRDEMNATVERIRVELDGAVEEAEASPMPEPAEAACGAYVDSVAAPVFAQESWPHAR